MSEQLAVVLRVDDDLLAQHPTVYGSDPPARCLSLAAAISASPAWRRLRDRARLTVRPDQGLIGLIGSFEPEDRPALEALRWQTEGLLRRLRPVPYSEVVETSLDLAEGLRAALAAVGAGAYRLEPIPRGGNIVAGLLAYALGEPGVLQADADDDRMTILVDDCALSGTRLRRRIAAHQGANVGVALLHASPELLDRVREAERSVRVCVAARDLVDHAPHRADYVDWRARWSERTPDDYWTGDPDHVCYPWNEPDALIWNDVTQTVETAWRVVPPSWCLKNRTDAFDGDIQECGGPEGPLRPFDNVIWAWDGDRVMAAAHGGEEVTILRGRAAVAWDAIVRGGTRAAVRKAVAGADAEVIIEALRARGLLPPLPA